MLKSVEKFTQKIKLSVYSEQTNYMLNYLTLEVKDATFRN